MNRYSTLLICGCVFLAFVLGLWISQPLAGQGVVPQPQLKVGRYQIAAAGAQVPTLYMCDTETGKIWMYNPANEKWSPMTSPVIDPKKK